MAELAILSLLWGILPSSSAEGASRDGLGFSRIPLMLPGIPAAVIPAEVNGDGIQDLAIVVAYTNWGDVTTVEEARFDGVEGMVMVMSVVSSLIEHRELRIYPGLSGGGYGAPLPSLELATSIHALAAGHPTFPLIAITDDGLAAVRFDPATASMPLSIEALIERPNLYSKSATFYPDLDFLVDLNNDEIPDVLLATRTSWVAFRGTREGFAATPLMVPPLPGADVGDEPAEADSGNSNPPPRHGRRIPIVRDLDGDALPELVLISPDGERNAVAYANLGDLRFGEPVDYGRRMNASESERDGPYEEFVYLGPLVAGGPSVAVTRTELERYEDPKMSEEIDEAKRPLYGYALNRIEPTLDLGDRVGRFEAIGYTFEGGDDDTDDDDIEIRLPGGFQDLDGDGREDLVSITLDFSLLPFLSRLLVAKSIKLTLNFHAWCQQEDGTFRETRNLDLSGKFKLNFKTNTLRHLSQFAGDFNGDGRADFIQLGRGKKVTIHHGQPHCEYPARPDGSIRLKHKLLHLGFARVLDLDDDGRSDLYVVHPLEKPKDGRSTPVALDLYLSEE